MKIAVVGNSCSGKTTLARKLSKKYGLPLTCVDSIQFLPGMKIRPHQETIATLTEIQNGPDWIIDGYGPLDIIEKRFELADQVIFIDFSIYRLYFWCLKRQINNLWSRREELPLGCDEVSFEHTRKLLSNISKAHRLMRPELLRIFGREKLKNKMIFVRTLSELKRLS